MLKIKFQGDGEAVAEVLDLRMAEEARRTGFNHGNG